MLFLSEFLYKLIMQKCGTEVRMRQRSEKGYIVGPVKCAMAYCNIDVISAIFC